MSKDFIARIRRDLNAGRFADAQKRVRPLAQREPGNAPLQNLAGICFARGQQPLVARRFFQAAFRIQPSNADFGCNLLLALVETGATDKAKTLAETLCKDFPRMARVWQLAAVAANACGDYNAAIQAADQALGIDPQHLEALRLRAHARSNLLQTEAAIDDYRAVLARMPEDLDALHNLADRLNEANRPDESLKVAGAILQLHPDDPFALRRMAALGEPETLPDLTAKVHALLARKPREAQTRSLLNQSMATILGRSGDDQGAMRFYAAMNAEDARARPYDSAAAWAEMRRITGLFPALTSREAAETGPRPIFVVGLPRSGTTLVEMILSAHPRVASCGELVAAERQVALLLDEVSSVGDGQLAQFADAYRADMPPLPDGSAVFIDKMPANFRYLGWLLSAFPEARAINVQRDPRDVALSLWRQRFDAVGMNYATRLDWIADQANLYQTYMRHWQEIAPARIHTIAYEDLVADVEKGARSMAAFCALDWAPQMAAPERNQAPVRTASVNQVREPVHRRSVGRWALLGDDLKRLTDRLDPALWPGLA